MKKQTAFILLLACSFTVACSNRESKPAKGTIKAGNLQVYYERQGKGDAILLLHAGLLNQTMWKEQVKALSAKYEVITVDLPFHGKTTGFDTTLLAQYVIKILLDSLQWIF